MSCVAVLCRETKCRGNGQRARNNPLIRSGASLKKH